MIEIQYIVFNNHKKTLSLSTALLAPTISVSICNVMPSNITVQWQPIDCNQYKGDITSYSVQYGVQGSGSTQLLRVSVSGRFTAEVTICGLEAATNYSIEVAAVGRAGIGEYSTPAFVTTKSM